MKRIRYLLNLCISVVILFYLFKKIPYQNVLSIMMQSQGYFFLISLFVGAFSVVLNGLRWKILLRYLNYEYDLTLLSKLEFIALFFNIYLPGGLAGEVTKAAILPIKKDLSGETKNHLTKVAASVVTDKMLGMTGLMLLALLGFIFSYQLVATSKILHVLSFIAFIVIFFILIFFSRRGQRIAKAIFAAPLSLVPPLKNTLKNVSESLLVYRENVSMLKTLIPISVAIHLCVVIYFFFIAQSINVEIGFIKLLFFVPLIEFVSTLPISFGGSGIRETATILMFTSEKIPTAEAMSVSLLSFILLLSLGGIGGILFLQNQLKDVKQYNKNQKTSD